MQSPKTVSSALIRRGCPGPLHRGCKGPSQRLLLSAAAALPTPPSSAIWPSAGRALSLEEPLRGLVPRLPHPARPPEHRVQWPRVAEVLGLHVVDVRLQRARRTERSCKPARTDVTAWGRVGAKGSPSQGHVKERSGLPPESRELCARCIAHRRTRARALQRGSGRRRELSR